MFDLESELLAWRHQMRAAGINANRMDELESHLREDIQIHTANGESETRAFQLAVARLGGAEEVSAEFSKIQSATIWPVKIGAAVWLAGVLVTAGFVISSKSDLVLAAHVLTVTAGYTAMFLLGGLGICHVCLRQFSGLSTARRKSLDRAVAWFAPLALSLVVAGLALSMVWSKQHWNRYWGWDAKEIGGLCVAAWLLGLVVLRLSGRIGAHLSMLWCVVGNAVVALSWLGAGLLDSQRNFHGYGNGVGLVLAGILGITFLFLVLGALPNRLANESQG